MLRIVLSVNFAGIILFASIILSGSGDDGIESGPCPEMQHLTEFDARSFAGTWHILSFKPNMFESNSLKCRRIEVAMKESVKGNVVAITSFDTQEGEETKTTREAKWEPSQGGLLKTSQEIFGFSLDVPLKILWTDYSKSGVGWCCVESFGSHADAAWIWSRTPTLDDETMGKMRKILEDRGVHAEDMVDGEC